MGRLAGSSPRWEADYAASLKQSEHQRRLLAAITPVVHPSAGRRQLALLWYVATVCGGQLRIGWRNDPPLTDDMRALIRKKQMILTRSSSGDNIARPPRSNWIGLTPAGEAILARARISDADKHYVEMAMKTGVVR
jgi:hypothetical protein